MSALEWPTCLPPLLAARFVGSFLGVLIIRLPEQRPWALARSCCAACGTGLAARDLVPLASFVLQRGRCRHCGDPIGWFHPAVELAAFGIAVWTVLAMVEPADIWASCLLGWTLLALAWIDARSMTLPDLLTLPLLLAGLGITWLREPDAVFWRAAGAAAGYLALRGVAVAYRALRGRDGMGAGDAKLLAAAGAWLGLTPLPWVVLLAAICGLAMAGLLAAGGRQLRMTTALPFGPCLAAAFWLLWLYGPP
jgi:leader peptidase (prepilin peptidase)/N-methyltransferase